MNNKIKTPTSSDTFIEEKMKGVDEMLNGIDKDEVEDNDGWWETSTGAKFGAKKKEQIKNFLKSSLQSQRQSILEEIEEKIKELGIQTDKADTQIQNEDFNEFFSKEDAEKLIHDNLIIIKALEDIKQLLK